MSMHNYTDKKLNEIHVIYRQMVLFNVFKAFCKYSHLQLLIIKTGKNYGCSQCRESTNGE